MRDEITVLVGIGIISILLVIVIYNIAIIPISRGPSGIPVVVAGYASSVEGKADVFFVFRSSIYVGNRTMISILRISYESPEPTTLYYVDRDARAIYRLVEGDDGSIAFTGEYTYLWIKKPVKLGDVLPVGKGYGVVTSINSTLLKLKVADPNSRHYLEAKYVLLENTDYYILDSLKIYNSSSIIFKLVELVTSSENIVGLMYMLQLPTQIVIPFIILIAIIPSIALLTLYLDIRRLKGYTKLVLDMKEEYYRSLKDLGIEVSEQIDKIRRLKRSI